MRQIDSKWTESLNFFLLCACAALFLFSSGLLHTWNRPAQSVISLSTAALVFFLIGLVTFKRNVRVSINDDAVEIHRFPYVSPVRLGWEDIKAIDVKDEFFDEYRDKTGEALYLHDRTGRSFLVAHRSGDTSELRRLAYDLRSRLYTLQSSQ